MCSQVGAMLEDWEVWPIKGCSAMVFMTEVILHKGFCHSAC